MGIANIRLAIKFNFYVCFHWKENKIYYGLSAIPNQGNKKLGNFCSFEFITDLYFEGLIESLASEKRVLSPQMSFQAMSHGKIENINLRWPMH